MDLLGYAALGGLERVAIVIGAVVVGYWGYRLYAGGRNAGLVFMGLAVAVLAGALATGSSHLKSLGEGYRLASTPAPMPPPEDAIPIDAAPTPAAQELAEPAPFTAPPAPHAAATLEPTPPPEDETSADDGIVPDATTGGPAPIEVVAEVVAPVRIATGQELGGRIVSIKSENVTLEWSNDSD